MVFIHVLPVLSFKLNPPISQIFYVHNAGEVVVADTPTNEIVKLEFLLILILQNLDDCLVLAQQPLDLILQNRPLHTLKHILLLVHHQPRQCSQKYHHTEQPVRAIFRVHKVYLLLPVLLNLLLRKLRHIDKNTLIERPQRRRVWQIELLHRLTLLFDWFLGLWQDNHFSAIG